MNKFDYKNLTPFKWFVLENFPFIEADFDALTEWQIFCKLGKEINKIIDSQNVVGTQMENVTNAFIDLQNDYIEKFNNLQEYVNNYFNNLDVQDEINNKLNEMAKDGTLQEIISSYLNSKAVFGFDNVEEMKNATNLIDGSYARTLGFYNKNDGGDALYKIRNKNINDNIDNMFVIEINENLVAELIIDLPLKPEKIGARGDGVSDDTLFIQAGINKVNNILMSKDYKVSEIIINKSDLKLRFNVIRGTIKVDATKLLQLIYVQGNRLINENSVGLSLISHNTFGIQYCKFSIGLIRANECIKFNSSDGGWINNNYFYKTNVSLGTGITSIPLTGNTYNGNMFVEFGFEDIKKWFNMNSFLETLFEKCRMIPFEADGQGTAVRELGLLNNCKNIEFNNKTSGTYYEFITSTNSYLTITGKAMKFDGTKSAIHMTIRNGNIDSVIFDTPIFKKNMSELTGTTIIQIYNYNVEKPIIFNYDVSKYTYVNLAIPDNIANALKYVDIVIIGTMKNSMTVTRNNVTLKEIPSNTSDTTMRFYF